MTELFGENRKHLLKQYRNEILVRFLIATIIYAIGVVLFFIFKSRPVLYLFPILLGILTMFYFGYLFYFVLMYFNNYRGNKRFFKRIEEEQDRKEHHLKLLSIDYMNYNMYGVFCYNFLFLDLDNKNEISFFVPLENLEEFSLNKKYHIYSFLGVMISYEEEK